MNSEQEILVDCVLASALAAYDGNFALLMAVFRPEVRALFDQPEFVTKTYAFVAARSKDPDLAWALGATLLLADGRRRLLIHPGP